MFEQCQDIVCKVMTEEFKLIHDSNIGKQRYHVETNH